MTKKQKKVLVRIIISAFLMIFLNFIDTGNDHINSLLYLIPYFIIGHDILKKALHGIRNREVFDENFLMAVATIGAIILGEYTEGVAVMLFYQIGELFQSYAVGKSRQNISELMDIRPDYANIENNGNLEQVDPDEIAIGTIITVLPGERIPIDGIIVEGSSALNTSALTGESIPRNVSTGDNVISGCINISGLLKIRTTKEFCDSTVSRILDLVENSSMKKSRSENFITRFARVYTPAVCYSALALAIIPPMILWLTGNQPEISVWITRALTFLVISCPCALVISIPLSFFGGIGGASARGILVKGSNYLEQLSNTRYIAFDKTGTLTKGVFDVVEITPANGYSKEDLLYYSAHAESYSTHPISKSLINAYGKQPDTTKVCDMEEISGHGVIATVDTPENNDANIDKINSTHKICVGNERLMNQCGIHHIPGDAFGTVVYIGIDGKFAGSIVISDIIKESSKSAISTLKKLGICTVILTGDGKKIADYTATQLDVDIIKDSLLPADKVTEIENLISQKKTSECVAFAGDGINDAPVLSRADIGIAMGAMGSDAAIEAADIVLMDDDPSKIALAIKISKKTLNIVRQNIVLALTIKFTCLILAAIGIANMWLAIFADVGVMVIAVLNATRALNTKNL